MAVLKVLQCKSCGGPLLSGTLKCPHCGAENKIAAPTEVNPLKMSQDMANKYINYFKKISQENPKDENSLFAMGMFYLGLKNYELAQRNFKSAVDLSPMEPDVYYYFALSLIAGRSPKNLNFDEAKRIEEWLCTAIGMQRKRKYLILLMFLRQLAFVANGLQIKENGEQPRELMAEIQTILPEADELTDIQEHVRIKDETCQEYLAILRGEGAMKSHDIDQNEYMGYASMEFPKGADEAILSENPEVFEKLNNESRRKSILSSLWKPNHPVHLMSKSYPIFRFVKTLIKAILIAFLLYLVELIIGFSFNTYKPGKTVDELYAQRMQNQTTHLTKRERVAIWKQLQNTVDEKAKKDSAKLSKYTKAAYDLGDKNGYHFGTPSASELPVVKKYLLINYRHLPITLIIIFLPLLLWIYRTVREILKITKHNNDIRQKNKENDELYDRDLKRYQERPSIHDYIYWCRHYLAANSPVVTMGDPVSEIMHRNKIDEKDLAGKIFFVNHFIEVGEDDEDLTDPADVLETMYLTVAIPQHNKLSIFYNRWDTTSNMFAESDGVSIFYNNISAISREDNELIISTNDGKERSIVLSPNNAKSVLDYQSEDPNYKLTYSITRSGSPNEFMAAIEKLISSHQDNHH